MSKLQILEFLFGFFGRGSPAVGRLLHRQIVVARMKVRRFKIGSVAMLEDVPSYHQPQPRPIPVRRSLTRRPWRS